MGARFTIERTLFGVKQAEINAAARKADKLLRDKPVPPLVETTILHVARSYLNYWGTASQDRQLQLAQHIEAVSAKIHIEREGKKKLRPARK